MIRLPATSISLSENDIQHHLRQLNVYTGLLAQGFKKKDIVRYYAEHNQQTRIQEYEPALSAVDMLMVNQYESLSISNYNEDSLPASPVAGSPSESPTVPPRVAPLHAPRRTSLLRFARNVSPESSSNEGSPEVCEGGLLPSFEGQKRKYRATSPPDPCSEFEVDDLAALKGPYEDLQRDFSALNMNSSPPGLGQNQMNGSTRSTVPPYSDNWNPKLQTEKASRLRPEAKVFEPYSLPAPFSASRRVSSADHNLPSASRISTPISPNYEIHSRSTPSLPLNIPSQDLHISDVSERSLGSQISTSSSQISASPYRIPERSSSNLSLGRLPPSTPSPIRTPTLARTEPRNFRQQNLDGTSFSVYNDFLPAANQPETPADLSRRPLLSESHTAYTAPPGRVRNTPATSPYKTQGSNVELGEQSPTVSSMRLRRRRQREFQRTARLESLRWERFRQQDAAAATLNFAELALLSGGREVWRDELEADGVGEENFETEEGVLRVPR